MNPDNQDRGARSVLAILISTFSIVGITIVSIAFIAVSNKEDRQAAASQVFTGILPLFGTWVGTLLAFYFAKENFDSATRNTVALSQISLPSSNNLESILVSSVISPNFVSFTTSSADREKSLEDVKKYLTDRDRGRLPILKESGKSLDFLVYYRDIDEFISLRKLEGSENTKLGDFIDYINTDPKKKKEVVFITRDISLAKADEERKKKLNCRDIIVTDSGKEDGVVIGYLTEVDIDKFSRPKVN